MDKQNYKPRIIDRQVEEYLSAFGAVCIEGPKWCGKTWTSSYHSKSEIYIGDPAGNFQNRQLAELSPALVLEGETPRLIDAWPLWDAVRYKVDQTAQKGQFILTGSATPNHKGILHSGAGRIARLRMRPMSLWESGDSSGKVSLEQLCHGTLTPVMTGEVDLKKLIELIIRGGWPGSLGLPLEQAALLPAQYLDAVIDDDVYRIDGVKRDTQKMRLLLRSLARNESTTVTNKTLMKDIKAVDDEDIDANTVAAYLDIFKRLFITDNQPPFSSGIRSSVRVKQAEKRHFADPSLACALLKATPAGLLGDLETLGFLFEALCERDLRIYASPSERISTTTRTTKIRRSTRCLNCPTASGAPLRSNWGPTRLTPQRRICWRSKSRSRRTPRASRPPCCASCAGWPTRRIRGRTGDLWCR